MASINSAESVMILTLAKRKSDFLFMYPNNSTKGHVEFITADGYILSRWQNAAFKTYSPKGRVFRNLIVAQVATKLIATL